MKAIYFNIHQKKDKFTAYKMLMFCSSCVFFLMPGSASCNKNEEAAQNQAVTSFCLQDGKQEVDRMVGVPEIQCLH